MIDNKNIFHKIGDWIESHKIIWVMPSQKESLGEFAKIFIVQLLILPWIIFVLITRVLFLVFIMFSIILYNDNKITEGISVPKTTKPLIIYLFFAFIIWGGIQYLQTFAREKNQSLIKVRKYHELTIPIDDYLSNNHFYSYVFKELFDACQQSHSSQRVIKIKKDLCLDEEFAKKFHFRKAEGLSAFIYSLQEIDEDVPSYLSETDKLKESEPLTEWLYYSTLEDFRDGNYNNAADKIKHYFEIYNNKKKYPIETYDINNTMHIMRLLLQHSWALTTHRDFAIKVLSNINIFSNNDYEVQELTNQIEIDENKHILESTYEELSGDSKELFEICTYFNGLTYFHQGKYENAFHIFEECFSSTEDNLLKQYCALMAIRTAFWNYDKERSTESLNMYYHARDKFSKNISLQYFLPDIQKYDETVKTIKYNYNNL